MKSSAARGSSFPQAAAQEASASGTPSFERLDHQPTTALRYGDASSYRASSAQAMVVHAST